MDLVTGVVSGLSQATPDGRPVYSFSHLLPDGVVSGREHMNGPDWTREAEEIQVPRKETHQSVLANRETKGLMVV